MKPQPTNNPAWEQNQPSEKNAHSTIQPSHTTIEETQPLNHPE
jgi:hypothetical protein